MTTLRPVKLPERFELDREIGRGGMAVVYRAQDRHLDRLVAIKVLSADLSDTVGAERFQRRGHVERRQRYVNEPTPYGVAPATVLSRRVTPVKTFTRFPRGLPETTQCVRTWCTSG